MNINCKGQLIDLSSPKVMGILNLTPDSFYDGGQYKTPADIIDQVHKMDTEGADFIDIGAYSSRPNADHISLEEEAARLVPVLDLIVREFPNLLISIDTFRSEIAKIAIDKGACMINDISAGSLDDNMFRTIADLKVPYILMHMVGTPQTMQQNVEYKNLMTAIIFYFSEKIFALRKLGVDDLIIDPGFGFSKTLDQNFELLQKLELLKTFDLPILAGLSRKSMLYKLLHTTPENALNATSIANTIAIGNGANVLRVHDVKEAVELIKISNKTTHQTIY